MLGLVTRRAMIKGALGIVAAAAAAPLGGVVEAAQRTKRAPSATVTLKLSVWPRRAGSGGLSSHC